MDRVAEDLERLDLDSLMEKLVVYLAEYQKLVEHQKLSSNENIHGQINECSKKIETIHKEIEKRKKKWYDPSGITE